MVMICVSECPAFWSDSDERRFIIRYVDLATGRIATECWRMAKRSKRLGCRILRVIDVRLTV